MVQTLQIQPKTLRFDFKDLESKEKRREIVKQLIQLLRIAKEKELWVKVKRIYNYFGDIIPTGVWHNFVEITAIGEDKELTDIARELREIYPYKDMVENDEEVLGYVTMTYEYSDTSRPSQHRYFMLWLTPVAHHSYGLREYAKRIISLIRRLDKASDALDALRIFISWCSATIYCYSTRGNLSKMYDSGGDYPKFKVIATYWG